MDRNLAIFVISSLLSMDVNVSASAGKAATGDPSATLFSRTSPFRPPIGMYVDTVRGETISKDMHIDLNITSNTIVQNNAIDTKYGLVDGQEVIVTMINIQSRMDIFSQRDIYCDSDDATSSHNFQCGPMLKDVGSTTEFMVDMDGSVDHDNEQSIPLDQVSAWMHIRNTETLLRLIPKHPVKPAQAWKETIIVDENDNLQAETIFKGFTNYQGYDVAVFEAKGTLQSSISTGMLLDGGLSLGGAMHNRKFVSKFYWDENFGFLRWSQTEKEDTATGRTVRVVVSTHLRQEEAEGDISKATAYGELLVLAIELLVVANIIIMFLTGIGFVVRTTCVSVAISPEIQEEGNEYDHSAASRNDEIMA